MFARFLLMLLAFVLCVRVTSAQDRGQAFVVDRYGLHVNGNSFERLDSVYLAGGAGPSCSGPGLADGDYYFEITDPAGTVLLSLAPLSERRVRAAGGYLTQYLGTQHLSSLRGPCGALFVQLAPFMPISHPGGEYKVWLTRVDDYDPLGTHAFGFDPARSKSDNFRVQARGQQTIVRGRKFFDHDEGGTWNPLQDPLEVPIGGWRVELWRNGALDGLTFTDEDGWYLFIRNRDGASYEVREVSPNGFVNDATPGATWLATTARNGTVSTATEYVGGPDFGNVSYELKVSAGRSATFWSDQHCNCNESAQNPPTCGVAILRDCDPVWRTALNTRNGLPVNLRTPVSNDNPSASIFTLNLPPQSFCGAWANWKSYANKNPHDHAGFLLSREVGTTILNNTCGFMQGPIYVDRFGDGVLVSLDDMLAGAIGLLSQTGAGLTGPNGPYLALRAMMIGCTNEFGRINETGDPTAPQVVYTRSELPSRVVAPY